MTTPIPSTNQTDVVLVGAAIMSAMLAVILKELDPSLKIEIYEVLGSEAQESSNAWNNAGTGQAALCELNYTPQNSDGSIDISKALQVNTEFDLSRQLWAYLVKKGAIKDPQSFIHPVPHFSFVRRSKNVAFLKKRFEALSAPLYHGMEYSDDKKQIKDWIPPRHGRPRSKRGSCGDANADRYRRRVWRSDYGSSELIKRPGRILNSLFQSSAGSATYG
jgi:malate dehydrogenase (quinone)